LHPTTPNNTQQHRITGFTNKKWAPGPLLVNLYGLSGAPCAAIPLLHDYPSNCQPVLLADKNHPNKKPQRGASDIQQNFKLAVGAGTFLQPSPQSSYCWIVMKGRGLHNFYF